MYKVIKEEGEMKIVREEDGKLGVVDSYGNHIVPCVWKDIKYPEWDWEILVQNEEGLWGVISQEAETVIPNVWHDIETYNTMGYIVRNADGDYGFLDPSGKTLAECRYTELRISDLDIIFYKDHEGRWGGVHSNDKCDVPCEWADIEDAFLTEHDYRYCRVKNADGLWGIVDRKGKVVLPCRWKAIECETYPDTPIFAVQNADDKWGVINMNEKTVLECRWGQVQCIDHFILVKNSQGLTGIYSLDGRMLTECLWEEVDWWVTSSRLCHLKEPGGHWTAINDKGEMYGPPIWKKILSHSDRDNLLPVSLGKGKYGVMTLKGEVKVPLVGDGSERCTEGWAVKTDGRWGVVDNDGEVRIACKWHSIESDHDGKLIIVRDFKPQKNSTMERPAAKARRKAGLCGAYDRSFNLIIPCRYKEIISSSLYGCYHVKNTEGLYGVFKDGEEAIPCIWKRLYYYPTSKRFQMQDKSEKWGAFTLNPKRFFEPRWKEIQDGFADYDFVRDFDNKWGMWDFFGKLILPCEYQSPRDAWAHRPVKITLSAIEKESAGKGDNPLPDRRYEFSVVYLNDKEKEYIMRKSGLFREGHLSFVPLDADTVEGRKPWVVPNCCDAMLGFSMELADIPLVFQHHVHTTGKFEVLAIQLSDPDNPYHIVENGYLNRDEDAVTLLQPENVEGYRVECGEYNYTLPGDIIGFAGGMHNPIEVD